MRNYWTEGSSNVLYLRTHLSIYALTTRSFISILLLRRQKADPKLEKFCSSLNKRKYRRLNSTNIWLPIIIICDAETEFKRVREESLDKISSISRFLDILFSKCFLFISTQTTKIVVVKCFRSFFSCYSS